MNSFLLKEPTTERVRATSYDGQSEGMGAKRLMCGSGVIDRIGGLGIRSQRPQRTKDRRVRLIINSGDIPTNRIAKVSAVRDPR